MTRGIHFSNWENLEEKEKRKQTKTITKAKNSPVHNHNDIAAWSATH
jgi:hypothetical protein